MSYILNFNLFVFIFALSAMFLGFSNSSGAVPVQWRAADGGNDHWYEVVRVSASYDNAQTRASNSSHDGRHGQLLTIGSSGEARFIASYISGLAGPFDAWIGGQSNSGGTGYEWVDRTSGRVPGVETTDVADGFTDYNPDPPVFGTGRALMYRYDRTDGSSPAGDHFWRTEVKTDGSWYLVEYGARIIIPLPASMPLMMTGFAALGLLWRRRIKMKGLVATS